MTDWTLDGCVGAQVTVAVCTGCQSRKLAAFSRLDSNADEVYLVHGQADDVGGDAASEVQRPVGGARSDPKHAIQLLGRC
jgi:hypothetical protein